MNAIRPDQTVAIVGSGTMGAGIAQIAAAAGHRVLVHDARVDAARQAVGKIAAALEKRAAQGKLSRDGASAIVGRIGTCAGLGDLAPAALVVEAIVEDLAAKQGLFRDLESAVGADAVLATNTSSISITAIAAALRRPERLVGMHFFNPVPVMALVEVVSGAATEPQAAETVFATAAAWGKSPVHARSTPGFIVNRVARPFYAEALRVLGEGGGDIATLDAVMREAGGFRMGPFELMDLIGNDVNFAVTRSVHDAFFQDPRFTPSLIQQELVAAGFLGRKSGRGFYRYGDGVDRPAATSLPLGPKPGSVVIGGGLEGLLPLMEGCGIVVDRDGTYGRIEVDGRVAIALTDGRTATERMAARRRPAAGPLGPRARLRAGEPRGAGAGRSGVGRGPCPGGWAVSGARQGGLAAGRRAGNARDADGVHACERGGRCGEPGCVQRGGGRYRDAPRRELSARPPGLGAGDRAGPGRRGAGEPRRRLWRGPLPRVAPVAAPPVHRGAARMSDSTLAQRTATAMFERDLASQGLGIVIEEVKPGFVRLRMPVRPDMVNGHATCHGGFIFALADSAFAFACNSHNRATVAAGAAIEFLAPARAGDVLIAEAQEQALGGRLGVYDVVVSREVGERVALFRGRSYALRTPVIADEGLL